MRLPALIACAALGLAGCGAEDPSATASAEGSPTTANSTEDAAPTADEIAAWAAGLEAGRIELTIPQLRCGEAGAAPGCSHVLLSESGVFRQDPLSYSTRRTWTAADGSALGDSSVLESRQTPSGATYARMAQASAPTRCWLAGDPRLLTGTVPAALATFWNLSDDGPPGTGAGALAVLAPADPVLALLGMPENLRVASGTTVADERAIATLGVPVTAEIDDGHTTATLSVDRGDVLDVLAGQSIAIPQGTIESGATVTITRLDEAAPVEPPPTRLVNLVGTEDHPCEDGQRAQRLPARSAPRIIGSCSGSRPKAATLSAVLSEAAASAAILRLPGKTPISRAALARPASFRVGGRSIPSAQAISAAPEATITSRCAGTQSGISGSKTSGLTRCTVPEARNAPITILASRRSGAGMPRA